MGYEGRQQTRDGGVREPIRCVLSRLVSYGVVPGGVIATGGKIRNRINISKRTAVWAGRSSDSLRR